MKSTNHVLFELRRKSTQAQGPIHVEFRQPNGLPEVTQEWPHKQKFRHIDDK